MVTESGNSKYCKTHAIWHSDQVECPACFYEEKMSELLAKQITNQNKIQNLWMAVVLLAIYIIITMLRSM